MREMIGAAKIVGLSEGQHAAAEPLEFRNRLFKYFVENLGFGAIAIESGIVESRVLNDYVTEGKAELDTVLKQGFSTGFDTFRQTMSRGL
jgi:erythromycin esterase